MNKKVNTEEFYDLFIQAGQKSAMTHKNEKIARYANLLKNYLINDVSTNEYLVEVFFNITENLSENEISKLSELQIKPLEIYYSFKNKPFDIERMKNDISTQKLGTDFRYIPKEYEFDSFYLYCFTRLEKLDLILTGTIKEAGGFISAGWSNQFQSVNTQINYRRNDEIVISDFGKKYIEWVTS
jgi:hypothetical protein